MEARNKRLIVAVSIVVLVGLGAWGVTTYQIQNRGETAQRITLDSNKKAVEQYSAEEAEKKKPISETKVGKIEEEVKQADTVVESTLTPFFKAMYSGGSFTKGEQVEAIKAEMLRYAEAGVVDTMTEGYGSMYQPSRPTIDGKGETGGSDVSYEMNGELSTGILSKTPDSVVYTVIVPFTNSNSDSNKALFRVTTSGDGKKITESDYKGTISKE